MQDQLIRQITKEYQKKNVPELRPGDTVRIHQRIREGSKERVQVFEGVVIALKHGQGLNGTFTVRKLSYGIGVERVFPLHSPRILKVERMKTADVRRAKLYYLRDLAGKSARLKNEHAEYAVWEEPETEAEIEKLEEETAAEAETAAAEKAEEEGEVTNVTDADEVQGEVAAEEEAIEEAELNADDTAASNPKDDAQAEPEAADEANDPETAEAEILDQSTETKAKDLPADTAADTAEGNVDDAQADDSDTGMPLEAKDPNKPADNFPDDGKLADTDK